MSVPVLPPPSRRGPAAHHATGPAPSGGVSAGANTGRARPWPGLRDGHSADTPSGGRATQPFCANPPGTPPGARQERRARDAPSARGLARRRTQPPPSPRTRPPPRSAPINPRAAPPAGGAGSACAFSAPERRAQARAPPGDRRGAWPRRRGAARGGRAHAGGGAHGAGPAPGRLVCAPRRAGGPGLRPSFSPRAARAAGPARSCAPLRGRRRAAAGKRMAAPAPDPQFTLRGAGSAVCALHFCSGAQGRPLLLSGSLRGLVHIWNLETRRPLAALDGHGGQCVTWLHTLPRGPQLLSQGRDLQLCVWDLAEGRSAVVDAMRLESVGFCRASVLAEGPQRWMLAVPGRGNNEVQILELPSKTLVSCLKPEAGARLGMPMCLQLWQAESSPRPLLLAGYEDGSLALWDVSVRKLCSRAACHSEPVMGLALDPRRARGVSGSAEKALAVWSLEGQQALQVRGTHELTNPGIADLKIRPDSKILATAGWDHRVRVFQWRTMRPLAVLAFHSATVHCVAFDATGLLAAGSGDQRISVWSLYPPT
ncbi:hypothetical protein AB1E18_012331 [Capra hircus]